MPDAITSIIFHLSNGSRYSLPVLAHFPGAEITALEVRSKPFGHSVINVEKFFYPKEKP